MILHFDSDAAYLVLPGARRRIAVYYFFSSNITPGHLGTIEPTPNCPIFVECCTLDHVVASAAEAEISGLFYNGQTILPIWRALTK